MAFPNLKNSNNFGHHLSHWCEKIREHTRNQEYKTIQTNQNSISYNLIWLLLAFFFENELFPHTHTHQHIIHNKKNNNVIIVAVGFLFASLFSIFEEFVWFLYFYLFCVCFSLSIFCVLLSLCPLPKTATTTKTVPCEQTKELK